MPKINMNHKRNVIKTLDAQSLILSPVQQEATPKLFVITAPQLSITLKCIF
jgi:hypothetical protein